jgi:hypothetical protein
MSKYAALIEDPPLPEQKYALLSFAEPRPSVLEQREAFFHKHFATWFYEQFAYRTMMDCMNTFFKDHFNQIQSGNRDQATQLFKDFLSTQFSPQKAFHQASNDHEFTFSRDTFQSRYEDFRALHFNELIASFRETLPRGDLAVHAVKVRGGFRSLEDASDRAQFLRAEQIEPYIDVFATEMGKWVPRNPYPDADSMKLSYDEEQAQLNQLIQSKKEEQIHRSRLFAQRTQDLAPLHNPGQVDQIFDAIANNP